MDNFFICYKIINGNYEWVETGPNIVMTQEYDKVIPVEEHVSRQPEKLIYDGEKLKLKEGETLLSNSQLDEMQEEEDKRNGVFMEDVKPQIVKVEF